MMKENRLDAIYQMIVSSKTPVSGTALAKHFQVSRQVIVQDIALLRAQNKDIISTHRGYICQGTKVSRIVSVVHSPEKIEEELNLIVDLGGKVENVFVEHEIYGHLDAPLQISSRKDVKKFLEQIKQGTSKPLTELTHGKHSHKIYADDEETLDLIEKELKEKNFIQSTQGK